MSLGAGGLGHLAQHLVTVPGRVPGRLDLLLGHRLAVDVQFDAGGRNQDVELRREREEGKRYLWAHSLTNCRVWF